MQKMWYRRRDLSTLVLFILDQQMTDGALAGAKMRPCVLRWFEDWDCKKIIFRGEGILHQMADFEPSFGVIRIFSAAGLWCDGALTLGHFIQALKLECFPGKIGMLDLGRCPCCFGAGFESPQCSMLGSCSRREMNSFYVHLHKEPPFILLFETKD